MEQNEYKLLSPDEPAPVTVYNPDGASPFFITCEHAGNKIPERLGTLGLEKWHLKRHIAWDVGILGVSQRLSLVLDAPLVAQVYSRLVIDCNRKIGRYDSMPPLSEDTEIPGNQSISEPEAKAREREVFWPYQDEIEKRLDERQTAGRRTILVSMHSFTPVFHGEKRPWHIGLLYQRDARFAEVLKGILANEPELCIGDNEPYAIRDESDYAIPVHAEQRGLLNIEIELRHDLIETPKDRLAWGDRLAECFRAALEQV